jgi:hypothetical protein
MKKKNLFTKYLIEAFVGLTIFVVCLRAFSIPIYFIKNNGSTTNQSIQILIFLIDLIFSALVTYKAIRYIHRNLNFNDNG